MTCKCGSDRIMSVSGKCSDLSSTNIPHLNFETDGYMPSYGVGHGDYIEFSVCLDCGQVQDWEPITDEMIKESEEWEMKYGSGDDDDDDDDDELPARPVLEAKTPEPSVISLVHIEKQRIMKLMEHAYGPLWTTDPEAREILEDTVKSPESGDVMRKAAKELLV